MISTAFYHAVCDRTADSMVLNPLQWEKVFCPTLCPLYSFLLCNWWVAKLQNPYSFHWDSHVFTKWPHCFYPLCLQDWSRICVGIMQMMNHLQQGYLQDGDDKDLERDLSHLLCTPEDFHPHWSTALLVCCLGLCEVLGGGVWVWEKKQREKKREEEIW